MSMLNGSSHRYSAGGSLRAFPSGRGRVGAGGALLSNPSPLRGLRNPVRDVVPPTGVTAHALRDMSTSHLACSRCGKVQMALGGCGCQPNAGPNAGATQGLTPTTPPASPPGGNYLPPPAKPSTPSSAQPSSPAQPAQPAQPSTPAQPPSHYVPQPQPPHYVPPARTTPSFGPPRQLGQPQQPGRLTTSYGLPVAAEPRIGAAGAWQSTKDAVWTNRTKVQRIAIVSGAAGGALLLIIGIAAAASGGHDGAAEDAEEENEEDGRVYVRDDLGRFAAE